MFHFIDRRLLTTLELVGRRTTFSRSSQENHPARHKSPPEFLTWDEPRGSNGEVR